MRAFLGGVGATFVGLGIALMLIVIPDLLRALEYTTSLQHAFGLIIGGLTPGGIVIIMGSVTYMLCSIDSRLQDIGEMRGGAMRSPPQQAKPAEPPAGSAAAQGGESNHGLF